MESIQLAEQVGLTEEDFKAALVKIDLLINRIRENALQLGEMMAGMSHSQIRQVKCKLKGILSSEHIDRIVLHGRGKIAPHLAIPPKSLPSSILRSLPATTLQKLNDPAQPIEVLTLQGVKAKTPSAMTAMELKRIVDSKTGKLLAPKDQRILPDIELPTTPSVTDVENAENFVRAVVIPGKMLLIVGENSSIKVPFKTLKQYIG